MQNILITLSLCIIMGLMLSRVAKKLSLPAVTAYLIAGLILGPFCLGLLHIPGVGFGSLEEVEGFSIISQVALGFIAFSIFPVLDLAIWKKWKASPSSAKWRWALSPLPSAMNSAFPN